MAVKLDQKDRRILYELDKDARQPLSAIAKKAALSRESILYRLKGYQKTGLIRGFLTVVDMAQLGFTHAKVYVKLHNATQADEDAFIKYLVNNPFIAWVASCDGSYSLVYGPKFRSMVELNRILSGIRSRFWRIIKHEDIATIIDAHHFYRDYLVGARGSTERRIAWGGAPEPVRPDATDIAILDALCADPRIPAVEIARTLGLSADAVLRRIRAMEQKQLITHYLLWPDVAKLRGIYYKVLVTLNSASAARLNGLVAYCLGHPDIVYAVNCLGPWQFEMDVEVADVQEFRALMRDFLARFSDIVSDYSALNVYEEHKFRFFEKECLKGYKESSS